MYVCRTCRKPIEVKASDVPVKVTKGDAGERVYVISCSHCGADNRIVVKNGRR